MSQNNETSVAFHSSQFSLRFAFGTASAAVILGIGTAAAQQPRVPVREGADLEMVVCTLPDRVIRLGANATYLQPGMVRELVARDCERKHGEYVLFDASNYDDALAIWLEEANDGDPVAQTHVGEFYELGLGVRADYSEAASWYRKAADQGDSRAQLSLAYLYEQGLGVEQDLATAINLYRKATGLDDEDLVFESDLVAARNEAQRVIDSLTSKLEEQTLELETLQSGLALTEQRLASRRSDLEAAKARVTELRAELDGLRAASDQSRRDELDRLEAQLAERDRELTRRMRELAELEAESAAQRSALVEERQRADQRGAELQSRLSEESSETQILREQLSKAQQEVYQAEQHEIALAAELAAERLKLSEDREDFARRNEILTEQQRRELDIRERRIEEQQSEIERLQQEKNAALQELIELRDTERQLIVERDRGTAELQSSQAQIATLQQRLLETEQRVAELVSATRDLESERERARLERESLLAREQEVSQDQRREIDRLTEKLAARDGQIADQQALIESLRSESLAYRDQIDALRERAETMLAMRNLEQSFSPALSPQVVEVSRRFRRDADLGEFHALLIANSEYSDFGPVDTAAKDIEAIAEILEGRYGFKVQTLHNATHNDIQKALWDYHGEQSDQRLNESDSLLIYYAGHGQLDDGNKRGYWLGVDATMDRSRGWIPDRDITDRIDLMPARHVLVIADSCYSGVEGMTRNSSVRLVGEEADHAADTLKYLARITSRTVLTSGANQPVISNDGGDHSVFARQFLELLRRNDGILAGMTLYNELYDDVTDVSRRLGREQAPQYAGIQNAGHRNGDFVFIPES